MLSPYIKIFYNFLSLLGLIGYLILPAKAQYTLVPDSVVYQQATHYALAHYRMHVGVQASIYQGKGFVNIHQKVDGHQFFESEDWEKGTIHYDGLTYSEVEMKYDVLNSLILVKYEQMLPFIKLESEKVSSFSVWNHHFIRLVEDSLSQQVPSTDFYDLLYCGKQLELLAKRKKLFMESVDDQELLRWFEDDTQYYIRQRDAYFPVKSKRSVLKVFADHKKFVNKYIKKNKLNFRRQTEGAILNTVMYYDQLSDAP